MKLTLEKVTSPIRQLPALWLWLTLFFVLGTGALIFRDFLFGYGLLLYTDIGADSVNDYYPTFVHLSDYLRNEGFPSWSFYAGMGQDLFYLTGYLILEPVVWLPKELIAHALVFQHLLKMMLAGALLFSYFQLNRLNSLASLLGALLLSCSAYMCMGSCWFPYADEVVCFTALLLGAELAVSRGRWVLLSLTVTLTGLLGAFFLYLSAVFLICYVPSRLLLRGWQPKASFRVCLLLAAAATLGVALGGTLTIPYLYTVLHSPRGSGTHSLSGALLSFPVFGLESPSHYVTAILRPFANDILGTGDSFRGWMNYLEAPLTYCGLVTLIMLPQAFIGATWRQRTFYLLFFAAVVIPTALPWFRHLFWLFQGDYYRAHSLFSVLGFLILSTIAFSRYLEGRSLNLWLLTVSIILFLAILYFPVNELQSRISPELKHRLSLFLLLYGALLTAGKLSRRQGIVGWLVLGLTVLELVQSDHMTVSNRAFVHRNETKAESTYDDETPEVVRDIKAEDHSSFYRITKPWSSGPSKTWPSLNDAMIFGYYGSSSYSSFNNVDYTNFLAAVGEIKSDSESETRWSVGLLKDPLLRQFGGEKYILTDNPVSPDTGGSYKLVRQYGTAYLFRNELALPLGLSYNRYMDEKVFRELSKGRARQITVTAAGLPW